MQYTKLDKLSTGTARSYSHKKLEKPVEILDGNHSSPPPPPPPLLPWLSERYYKSVHIMDKTQLFSNNFYIIHSGNLIKYKFSSV